MELYMKFGHIAGAIAVTIAASRYKFGEGDATPDSPKSHACRVSAKMVYSECMLPYQSIKPNPDAPPVRGAVSSSLAYMLAASRCESKMLEAYAQCMGLKK